MVPITFALHTSLMLEPFERAKIPHLAVLMICFDIVANLFNWQVSFLSGPFLDSQEMRGSHSYFFAVCLLLLKYKLVPILLCYRL